MNRFNVRAYLIIIENDQLLLSDEILGGQHCTKFPGGGLEWGEGLIECCHREALEELNSRIEVVDHFYTTEGYYPSSFRKEDQVLAIYYTAKLLEKNFPQKTKKFDFQTFEEREESFRWVGLDALEKEEMTFPIDRIVIQKLIDSQGGS